MKKIAAAALLFLLTASLWGCHFSGGTIGDSVSFYYQRVDFTYGDADGIIAPEKREVSGHRENLSYLLTLYLRGPQDAALCPPFPAGTTLWDIRTEDQTLVITLSAPFAQLENIDLTIACTCLARTCFDLTDAQTVLIEAAAEESDTVSVSIDRDSYLLIDSIPETTPTE